MVSDFLISLAYFSISLELCYFLNCTHAFPFRWVVIEFGAYIVLCGLTRFINTWIYQPPPFSVMPALTVCKFLTALVSCATAITLFNLIPELLKIKARELFLKNKANELDREVDLVKRKEETSRHVHMLTQEIRSSLDRHTILNTSLVYLSKTFNLENCAIWMPLMDGSAMKLTHELRQKHLQIPSILPISSPDIEKIKASKNIMFLDSDSLLAKSTGHPWSLTGPVAAIRVPLLKSADFKGEISEHVETVYAILVLVLSCERQLTSQEIHIVEVVGDQVAVALSHAAVLEEFLKIKEPLIDQNRAVEQAKKEVIRANQACHLFQSSISQEMGASLHSIIGISSLLLSSNLNIEQQKITRMLAKISSLLSSLVNDTMDFLESDASALVLQLHPFHIHDTLRSIVLFSKHASRIQGLSSNFYVGNGIPDHVIGDEKMIFQVFLFMIGHAISLAKGRNISVRIFAEDRCEQFWQVNKYHWRPPFYDGLLFIKFEIKTSGSGGDQNDLHIFIKEFQEDKSNSFLLIAESLGYALCTKLVELMHGNIWVESNSEGGLVVTFIVRVQLQTPTAMKGWLNLKERIYRISLQGLNILVADDNKTSRTVTEQLLQELGCTTTGVDSGCQCLTMLLQSQNAFQVLFLEVSIAQTAGCEVAFCTWQKCQSRNCPLIVALTSSRDKKLRDRCHQIGIDGFILKPITLRDIEIELMKIIQNAHHIPQSKLP